MTQDDKDKKKLEQEIKRLKELYVSYKTLESNAMQRKLRLEAMMQRHIAMKWNQAKKAKMVRRLIAVSNELKEAQDVISQVEFKLLNVEPTFLLK